ncbi:hypothetical protein [Kribbella sindirgiensis]|uniref:Uncharacterized protein n=1 Tax=Kribbella sindirgiensis TaxID=1124744 RepID=A0A4R0HXK5_9ACTN|nr:hypothetical protein [Kribbella sindirgiensis]TCC16088.1 hypothetical protein E0H50_41165 [Kribbella sindirgiensis]
MPTVPRRELVASLLIVVLLAIQLPFVALGNRADACLSLILIGAVVLLLAGSLSPDPAGWLAAGLAVASASTGTVVIALPSALLATISISTLLVLWSVDVSEHLTFRSSERART